MYSYNKEVRQALRDNPDGLRVAEIVVATGAPENTVNRLLRNMPDAYIDRWVHRGTQKHLSAIWCVVVPPPDCPKPERRTK
jgi:hypothetical protein